MIMEAGLEVWSHGVVRSCVVIVFLMYELTILGNRGTMLKTEDTAKGSSSFP